MPSEKTTGADNQQERLEPYWIVGFVDGEGCFSVSYIRNQTTKSGYQIFPEFVVTQGAKSLMALKAIQRYFGCGKLFINRRNDNHKEPIYRYCVRSLNDLWRIIIPFFERYRLQTAKQNDFKLFSQIVAMMLDKHHLNKQGRQKILTLKSRMNRRKKRRL